MTSSTTQTPQNEIERKISQLYNIFAGLRLHEKSMRIFVMKR